MNRNTFESTNYTEWNKDFDQDILFTIEKARVTAKERSIKATWAVEYDPIFIKIVPPKKWSYRWFRDKIRKLFRR